MGKYFGTDGFRGEANIDLTVEHAYKVGRFLGWYFGKDHKAQIVIGKDTRRSSYMFEYSLVAGLTASGADAYLLHVTTTPSAVSYTHLDVYKRQLHWSAESCCSSWTYREVQQEIRHEIRIESSKMKNGLRLEDLSPFLRYGCRKSPLRR